MAETDGTAVADLLSDSERRREHAAALDASVMGFSSQERMRREGRPRQKDKSGKRLQLKRDA
jgi:hypothetical protein